MTPSAQLFSFAAVVLVGAVSPGPDFVVLTHVSALSGRRAGIACGLGVACGVLFWAVAIALGTTALFSASAVAFQVTRLAGAAYLVVLGVNAWRAVRRNAYPQPSEGGGRIGTAVAFRRGLV